ncbi:H(+)/Cl(-) exchange transporter 7 [Ischnura elegans]|uniref:H(+)/Cl(-) exchange transporter 7 n=1 Tax=Ischnura elegans TaxID=197161 RepID=UPI001ED87EFF|nr:H(+)/Cl(-) exchange transporter 7 [Ischnura elegans]
MENESQQEGRNLLTDEDDTMILATDEGLSINNDPENVPNDCSVRRRRATNGTVEPGSLNVLSSKLESLDYDICENDLLLEEDQKKGYAFVVKKNLARWLVFFLIGITTALIASIIDIAIEELSAIKYGGLKESVDNCVAKKCLIYPYLLWVAANIIPVIIGSVLVAYVEPCAAGSGIPQVKCYLNGVKVPRVVRIKTLAVKAIGVVTSVVGGLAVGKEGPMIHSGAVVAAGISQGKSTSFAKDFKLFRYFREDHEKRDFVSGGAAAGVAAAFGAPVGGVLFSLEEGASFWNQSLTWRIFFASMISTFTLNVVLSAYHNHPGQFSFSGLLNFGQFDSINYEFFEFPIFLLMGAIGGLLGALFNHINYKLTVFRMRYVTKKACKVTEAVMVAAISATLGFVMIYFLNDCKPLGQDPTKFPIQMHCNDGEYNAVAAIWFQTPEASVRSFFHDPPGSHKALSVGIFFSLYFLLSCWTYGLSVSSGLFIPTLLTGAAWGRLVGMGLESLAPNSTWATPGKYALVGAAAQLGGVVRMTISLTVILIEATGSISFGLPLMIVLISAKWVGDYFNEGVYDIHIQLSGVPILAWQPPPLSSDIRAQDVMSHPVVSFKTVENVGHIVDVLKKTSFNGFPVVEPSNMGDGGSVGLFKGLIIRSHLIVLLQNKIFHEPSQQQQGHKNVSLKLFRDAYPRYPTIGEVHVSPLEQTFNIDLRPFMNRSPYSVQHSASLPRIFRLFRALGLRHLVVVNSSNEVIGMVTRKDLARFRVWKHRGMMGLEKLLISEKL